MRNYFIAFIFVLATFSTLNAAEKKYDRETGLIIAEGLEEVKENCSVCHPGRFMVMNGGNRKFWKGKIVLMQKGFGLWDLDQETEDTILKYLSIYYPKQEKKEEDE